MNPLPASSETELPWQIVFEPLEEIVGVNAEPIVVVMEVLPVHPFEFVTVTEKVFAVLTVNV